MGSRPLHYEWVKKVYDACVENDVQFIFGQTGNIFIKDGKDSTLDRLTEFLPKLSAAASKDDMSLAGYINKDAIRLEEK